MFTEIFQMNKFEFWIYNGRSELVYQNKNKSDRATKSKTENKDIGRVNV